MQQVVGVFGADDGLSLGAPFQPSARRQRDVGQSAESRRAVARLDVGVWLLSRLDAIEKITSVKVRNTAVGPVTLHFQGLHAGRPILELVATLGHDVQAIPIDVDFRADA